MKEKFKSLMETMSTDEIIEPIRKTWKAAEGAIFREFGFDIIEEREGEDEADRIYAELFASCN